MKPLTAPTPATTLTDAPSLRIDVAQATGSGPTTLAAFDVALRAAGVANFNLLLLSSIAPPASRINVTAQARPTGGWGDRLYVVLAEERVQTHNEEAWAGIGWVQEREQGRGLFVEHHGHSQHQVEADISATLENLMQGRPQYEWGQPGQSVVGVTCIDEPVCALVVAVFESAPWEYSEGTTDDIIDLT